MVAGEIHPLSYLNQLIQTDRVRFLGGKKEESALSGKEETRGETSEPTAEVKNTKTEDLFKK